LTIARFVSRSGRFVSRIARWHASTCESATIAEKHGVPARHLYFFVNRP
jgi:hypothetical protein